MSQEDTETIVLHLSDLHIGKKGNADALRTIVDMVEEHYLPDDTVVIITGDIAEHGQKKQFEEAREILDPLYQDQAYKVLCVPGNHDYGFLGNHAERRRFGYFKQVFYGLEQVTYPHVRLFNGHIFIGLNSMKGELGIYDSFWADGELGKRQLKRLDGILKQIEKQRELCPDEFRRVVVYLHHHPFLFEEDSEFRRVFEKHFFWLKDGKDLMNILAGRVDALLFGHKHNHINLCSSLVSDDWNIPVILSCGASTTRSKEHVLLHPALSDGARDVERCPQTGLLGHLIRIPSNGDRLRAETVVF